MKYLLKRPPGSPQCLWYNTCAVWAACFCPISPHCVVLYIHVLYVQLAFVQFSRTAVLWYTCCMHGMFVSDFPALCCNIVTCAVCTAWFCPIFPHCSVMHVLYARYDFGAGHSRHWTSWAPVTCRGRWSWRFSWRSGAVFCVLFCFFVFGDLFFFLRVFCRKYIMSSNTENEKCAVALLRRNKSFWGQNYTKILGGFCMPKKKKSEKKNRKMNKSGGGKNRHEWTLSY